MVMLGAETLPVGGADSKGEISQNPKPQNHKTLYPQTPKPEHPKPLNP